MDTGEENLCLVALTFTGGSPAFRAGFSQFTAAIRTGIMVIGKPFTTAFTDVPKSLRYHLINPDKIFAFAAEKYNTAVCLFIDYPVGRVFLKLACKFNDF